MARKGYSVDKSEWIKMKRNLTRNKASIQLGWFDGMSYGSDNGNLPMAQVAKWVEEGHINGGMFKGTYTPPRPFIRTKFIPTIAASDDFLKAAVPLIDKVARGQMTWNQLHKKVAPKLIYLFKLEMKAYSVPANTKTTAELKGFNDPWRNTGTLIDAAAYRIGPYKLVAGSYKG